MVGGSETGSDRVRELAHRTIDRVAARQASTCRELGLEQDLAVILARDFEIVDPAVGLGGNQPRADRCFIPLQVRQARAGDDRGREQGTNAGSELRAFLVVEPPSSLRDADPASVTEEPA